MRVTLAAGVHSKVRSVRYVGAGPVTLLWAGRLSYLVELMVSIVSSHVMYV